MVVRRPRGDRGVVAVLTAVMVATVLVPVSALGLSAYTRSATSAELSRAADAGALAGAAAVPLADLDAIQAYLADAELAQVALDVACQRALRAAGAEATLARTYVTSPRTGGVPRPTCDADYTPDTELAACADALADTVDEVTGEPAADPLVKVLVKALAPALFRNGVEVRLTWQVRGPLDGVFNAGPTTQTAVARARRRFNPLGLDALPAAVTGLASVQELREQLAEVFAEVADDVDDAQPGCGPGVEQVAADVDDALQAKGEEETLVECATNVVEDVLPPLALPTAVPTALPPLPPLVVPTAVPTALPPLPDVDLEGCQRGVFRAQLAG